MYQVLIKLIVGASILQVGIGLTDSQPCSSRECLARIERASRKVLQIDWKPISIFPEESKRFQ